MKNRSVLRKILVLVSVVLSIHLAQSQTPVQVAGTANATASQSGNWTDPNTWGGSVPGNDARVLIPANITVTVDGVITQTFKSIRIAANGKLQYATAVNTELRTEYLVSEPSGSFEIGNGTTKIAAGVTAKLIFAEKGGTTRAEDPNRFAPGAVLLGPVRMHGADKTSWLPLATHPSAGANQLVFKSAPSGWNAGDKLVVAGTDPNDYRSDELVTISQVSGTTVTLTSTLTKNHVPPSQLSSKVDVHVSNNSRNIIISSENTSVSSISGDYRKPRGHLMFMHNADVILKFIETDNIGRTDKRIQLDDWDATGLPREPQVLPQGAYTNPRGRYSIHFHRSIQFDKTQADYTITPPAAHVEGCAVNNDPGWGYVNHSSHVNFIRNVSYDVVGSAFCTEAGNEIGSFMENIAIRTYNPDEPMNIGRPATLDPEGGRTEAVADSRENFSDFAWQGDGFWFHSTGVKVEGNVVSGSTGHAYVYWTEGLVEDRLGIARGDIDIHVPASEFPALNADLKAQVAQFPNWNYDIWFILPRPFKNNVAYASARGIHGYYIMTEFHEVSADDPSEYNITPTLYRNTMNFVIENNTVWAMRRVGVGFNHGTQITLRNNKIYGYGTNTGKAAWNLNPNPFPGLIEDEPAVIGMDLDHDHNTRNWLLENNVVEGFEGDAVAITLPVNANTIVDGGTFNNGGIDMKIREVNWRKNVDDFLISDSQPWSKTSDPWRTLEIKGNIQFNNTNKNIVMAPQMHLANPEQDGFPISGGGLKARAYFMLPDKITLNFGPFSNSRLYFDEQRADFVPATSTTKCPLGWTENPNPDAPLCTPDNLVGKTNQQLNTEFGTSLGGEITPASAQTHAMIVGGRATNISATTNQNPTCSVTSPTDNSSVTEGQSVTIEVTASDSDGSVSQVEFFVDDASVGTDNSAPYSMSWAAAGVGNHSIKAIATDNGGATTTSSAITLVVNSSTNQAPTVSISSPANNSSFNVGDNVSIEASASDSDGSVAQVEFFVNDASIGVDSSSPYAMSWTATAGNHSLKAVAKDNGGSVTTSSVISISVGSSNNQAPTISITSPNANTMFEQGENVDIEAAASDSDGTVAQVEFFVNDVSIGVSTEDPYEISWTAEEPGDHTLKAIATDNGGATSTSALVPVTVNVVLSSVIDPSAMTIFPNPVNGDVMNLSLKGWKGEARYSVTDMNGRVLRRGLFAIQDDQSSVPIHVSTLSVGAYVLKLSFGTHSESITFLKE